MATFWKGRLLFVNALNGYGMVFILIPVLRSLELIFDNELDIGHLNEYCNALLVQKYCGNKMYYTRIGVESQNGAVFQSIRVVNASLSASALLAYVYKRKNGMWPEGLHLQ